MIEQTFNLRETSRFFCGRKVLPFQKSKDMLFDGRKVLPLEQEKNRANRRVRGILSYIRHFIFAARSQRM